MGAFTSVWGKLKASFDCYSPPCGNPERAIDDFEEGSFFTKDESLSLRHFEVGARFRIRLQTCSVSLISGQTNEGNQTPGNCVRPFPGKEITYQVSSASGDDPAPILCVSLKVSR